MKEMIVGLEWDDGSRQRQENLFLLIGVCILLLAALYLAQSEPLERDTNTTTTTEVSSQ